MIIIYNSVFNLKGNPIMFVCLYTMVMYGNLCIDKTKYLVFK